MGGREAKPIGDRFPSQWFEFTIEDSQLRDEVSECDKMQLRMRLDATEQTKGG